MTLNGETGAPSAPARAMNGLRRLVRVLRSSNTASERQAGLTAAQVFVLSHIAGYPGCSLRDVAARTLTTQSTASEVVAGLVDRGLVQRAVAAGDRRRVALSASALGRRTLQLSDPPVQERLIAALAQLSVAQQESIAAGLTAWLEAAGFGAVSPVMFFEPDTPSSTQLPISRKGKLEMTYQPIDPSWTVNDVLLRYPQTASAFRAFGIDSCCGGALPLEVVAGKHRLDLKTLIGALEECAGRSAPLEANV